MVLAKVWHHVHLCDELSLYCNISHFYGSHSSLWVQGFYQDDRVQALYWVKATRENKQVLFPSPLTLTGADRVVLITVLIRGRYYLFRIWDIVKQFIVLVYGILSLPFFFFFSSQHERRNLDRDFKSIQHLR